MKYVILWMLVIVVVGGLASLALAQNGDREAYLPLIVRGGDAGPGIPVSPTPTPEPSPPTEVPTEPLPPTATSTQEPLPPTNTPEPPPPTSTLTPEPLPPTPTPQPIIGVANGDFERGSDGWNGSTDTIIRNTFAPDITPYSGAWAAVFDVATDNQENRVIWQNVTVPEVAPYLSYWLWINSTESTCGDDIAGLGMVDEATQTTLIADQIIACEANNTDGWIQRQFDLSDAIGKTLYLELSGGSFDTFADSAVYIDNVTFQE